MVTQEHFIVAFVTVLAFGFMGTLGLASRYIMKNDVSSINNHPYTLSGIAFVLIIGNLVNKLFRALAKIKLVGLLIPYQTAYNAISNINVGNSRVGKVFLKIGGWTAEKGQTVLSYVLDWSNRYWWAMVIFNFVFMAYFTTIGIAILVLAAILLHEGGHYFVQRQYGYKPDLYVFPILGAGVSEEYDKEEISEIKKRDVFAAGPVASFVFIGIATVGHLATGSLALLGFAIVFILNSFTNLLPFWKVDGGRLRESTRKLSRQGDKLNAGIGNMIHLSLVVGNFLVLYLLVGRYGSEITILVIRSLTGLY